MPPQFFVLLIASSGLVTISQGKVVQVPREDSCGYKSCPVTKPDQLNVHLVPHSHDDIGWLKTVDQYYYGDRNDIQQAAVQYTIDSVVTELQKNPDRRFIYVETGFFWRWWNQQDAETQAIVTQLVNNGQLEFISGGWVMNDEAGAHYNAIIDQMTLGMRWLNETFGECALPKVGWQIDPFGHSREQASLFAQMGLDGLFFGRLDYQDKTARKISRNMEMVWSGSPKNLGKDAQLFTSVLFNGYNPPDGFCFDIFCTDDPINDDPRLFGYNVGEKVKDFVKASRDWGKPYTTNNVLMTMGSDFQYLAAHTWYKNLDKLIKYVNKEDNGINVLYSTPSCYLQEVNKAGLSYGVKEDDFFPYASDPHAFWTGYFTSRPAFKYHIQHANNFLQACKQLTINEMITKPNTTTLDEVFVLQEAVAVMQHHDAVSGTAKQHVTDDYALRLSIGMDSCSSAMSSAMGGDITFCHSLNISSCPFTVNKTDFLVNVYNPLVREVKNVYVRVPVVGPEGWRVFGPDGIVVESQVVMIPLEVTRIPGREGGAEFEVVWRVDSLLGLGWGVYRLSQSEEDVGQKSVLLRKGPGKGFSREDFTISNDVGLTVTFSGESGRVKGISLDGQSVDLDQNFYFYEGMSGNNSKFEFRASGAYIFRPNVSSTSAAPTMITSNIFSYHVYQGDLVTEVHQVFTDWVSQVVRVYKGRKEVEFEWLVGPVPVGDSIGREIITRYSTNLVTSATFQTDANGRELLTRKRDYRPTWDYKVNEPIAGNYYPVNSRIILQDETNGASLVVLNDRAQGGSSMNDGEVELMLHRRLLFDDAFGVGEALNESAFGEGLVVRGRHWVILGGKDPAPLHRPLAQEIFMDRIISFAPYEESNAINPKILGEKTTIFSALSAVLPPNVHLLTLEPLSGNQFILRLEHFYEKGETGGDIVRVDIGSLHDAMPFIKSIREATLSGNQWKSEVKRMEWGCEGGCGEDESNSGGGAEGEIVLRPMEIKTFVVGY